MIAIVVQLLVFSITLVATLQRSHSTNDLLNTDIGVERRVTRFRNCAKERYYSSSDSLHVNGPVCDCPTSIGAHERGHYFKRLNGLVVISGLCC